MMRSQNEQAEAKVAALQLRARPGKKEGGSKEIKCLIAAEAEKTRALERLMVEEVKKSRWREEKLQEMQREMTEWRTRYEETQSQLKRVEMENGHLEEQVWSLETHLEASSAREAAINTERKQSQLQRLTLRQQIRALEAENKTLQAASSQTATKGQDSRELEGPEVTSTATQMEAVQEDPEGWQERCLQAEYQVEELREKLIESYAQAEKTGKAITKEIEKAREYMASHEALEEQKQSLETEVRARTKECVELRAQWQKVEKEKDHLGKEMQSLRTLLEESTAREMTLRVEIEQQTVQAAQPQRESLTTIGLQLEEHASRANTEYQEQLRELETLKGILVETEKWVETARAIHVKDQEPHKNTKLGGSKKERGVEKQEKGTMTEGPP
ncbi:hypothetical protein Y1Q_0010196 [Alligator mississippiensis]|uniref:Uncharacterized protein n=1 Tax=Alligator mississippiensis TaxID=8496 RepID=A0A151NG34_ALLMI|nr:hypothetical protein Y1Q_0010196 [Alligator mississippiensis]